MVMWAAIAAILVPLVTALASIMQARAGSVRGMKEHAEIASKLTEGSEARKSVEALVKFQADVLLRRAESKANRKLNGANLAAAIVLTALTGAVLYAGILLVQWAWPTGFGWVPLITVVGVGIFLLALTATGYASMYNPPRPKK